MAIYYEHITVDVFPISRILKLNLLQAVNKHTTMYLEGIIASEQCEDKLCFTDYRDQPIHIMIDEKTEFTALIQQVKFLRQNNVTTVVIYAASADIKMDRVRHSRSFQNISITYQAIFDAIGKAYSLDNVIACDGAKREIEEVIIQYNETDWAFYLRMASHIGALMFPVPKSQNPLIYIDKRETIALSWEQKEYSVLQNGADHFAITGIYDEIYPLGQAISLNGRTFYLKSSRLYMQNAQLKNRCIFASADGLSAPKSYNETIVGAALIGTVLEVGGTDIKLKLDIDKEAVVKGDNTHWFEYMSVYSSPEGNSWYFMPEIGDRAYLKVPGKKEGAAYATGAVHVTDTGRSDPQIKFIKTKDGKIIRFTPGEIDIMVTPKTYIKLYDKGGIDVVTDGDINFSAGNDININAQKEVSISGKKCVTVKKGASKIVVSDNVTATGKKVKLI